MLSLLLLPLLHAAVGAAGATVPLGPTVTLRGGVVMPSVGLGNGGGCHPDPDGTERHTCESYNVTTEAMGVGYRAFHDALSYGNQAGLGAAVKDSKLDRSALFLMSMVPTYLMGYNETVAAVHASLAQMQLEHLDLVMIHHRAPVSAFPRTVPPMKAFPGTPIVDGRAAWGPPACAVADPSWVTCQTETWDALLAMKKAGKVRAVGVSNWEIATIQRMIDRGVELPAVNQIEAHIGWHDDELIAFCHTHGIVVQAATPLARFAEGILTGNAVVAALATKYSKSAAQVALRYLLEKGVAMIPSAHTVAYQAENLDIFDFRLLPSEVAKLGAINAPCRTCDNCYKCWGDPKSLMCTWPNGTMLHCP